MEGLFNLIWQRESKIAAHLKVKIHSQINCNLSVAPTNYMEGVYNVQPLKRIIKNLNPIRDAFIRNRVPTLNNGAGSELLIGYDSVKNEIYRSFIKFDLSSIPQGMLFEKATLTFTCKNIYDTFDNLEISTINSAFD
jgi:hypothetical protein